MPPSFSSPSPSGPESSILPPRYRRDSISSEHQAHLQLEIARLFLAYGKTAVARKRLKRIADQCGDSPTAVECRTLLAAIELQTEQGAADLCPAPRLASA